MGSSVLVFHRYHDLFYQRQCRLCAKRALLVRYGCVVRRGITIKTAFFRLRHATGNERQRLHLAAVYVLCTSVFASCACRACCVAL